LLRKPCTGDQTRRNGNNVVGAGELTAPPLRTEKTGEFGVAVGRMCGYARTSFDLLVKFACACIRILK
jgi:hypothetical protein